MVLIDVLLHAMAPDAAVTRILKKKGCTLRPCFAASVVQA
jgi:hypothetical protein